MVILEGVNHQMRYLQIIWGEFALFEGYVLFALFVQFSMML